MQSITRFSILSISEVYGGHRAGYASIELAKAYDVRTRDVHTRVSVILRQG